MERDMTASELAEAMTEHGWDAVWFIPARTEISPDASPADGLWFVGCWTGPDCDLVCVKYAATAHEAEEWLSPEGRTLREAVNLAAQRLAGHDDRPICQKCQIRLRDPIGLCWKCAPKKKVRRKGATT